MLRFFLKEHLVSIRRHVLEAVKDIARFHASERKICILD